jgi:hypothetical protein
VIAKDSMKLGGAMTILLQLLTTLRTQLCFWLN